MRSAFDERDVGAFGGHPESRVARGQRQAAAHRELQVRSVVRRQSSISGDTGKRRQEEARVRAVDLDRQREKRIEESRDAV